MKTSFVILTHNRCPALLSTLNRLAAGGHLSNPATEVIVVDNGSTDQTQATLRATYPGVRIVHRPTNEGVSARNHAFAVARGRYVVLIDDDSYPEGDAVERSTDYLDQHPDAAAVGGRVVLPNGNCEASAFPTVVINCAVCLRKSVLDEVGGFPPEFFRQAEEYDLSFRIWQAGYRIARFEDVIYRHDKAAGNRAPALVCRMDLRNNLILAERYLPGKLRAAYRADWAMRYTAIARQQGHGAAALQARWQARGWAVREVLRGRRVLGAAALESIFGFERQAVAVAAWAKRHTIRRAAIADFGKNVYATLMACRAAGLEVTAIADNSPAFTGLHYRGLAIQPDAAALASGIDGVVVANINPAQVGPRCEAIAAQFAGPVLRLWEPTLLGAAVAAA